MLHLRIGFPGGRYYAATNDDPRQPEWPPHPSRVYSALVAAAYAGGRQPTPSERLLLQRLEAAPLPSLAFPPADLRPAAESFVPVNDPKSRIEAKKGQSHGVLLPNRQVRHFPAAFLLDHPEVVLSWPLELSAQEIDTLDHLAARMTHVGTSHSLVTARFAGGDPDVTMGLVPDSIGEEYLRVPRSGRLAELDQLAEQGYGTLRRPPPACEVPAGYGRAPQDDDFGAPSAYDWVTLRMLDASWGADTSHTLARAFRRAALSIAGAEAPACLHGHDASTPHIAWLPLPDVGHVHARGRIRGIAIALPLSISEQERALALAAISRLEILRLPDGQQARIAAIIEGPETPNVLRTRTWIAPSKHWSTVTPILLDHPPKRATSDAILDALAASLVNAGYPPPVAVMATRGSDFDGAPSALDIPTRIPRWHARVTFRDPLRGPVLAGRWRYFGVGLLRPTPPDLCA